MKFFNISLLLLFIFGMQNLAAKRMESSLYVKQTIDKAVKALEESVQLLEEIKNSKIPEGTKLLSLSSDEIQSLDNGINKLKVAICALR